MYGKIWMKLEKIMLSDKSQKQNNHKFHDSIYTIDPE